MIYIQKGKEPDSLTMREGKMGEILSMWVCRCFF